MTAESEREQQWEKKCSVGGSLPALFSLTTRDQIKWTRGEPYPGAKGKENVPVGNGDLLQTASSSAWINWSSVRFPFPLAAILLDPAVLLIPAVDAY